MRRAGWATAVVLVVPVSACAGSPGGPTLEEARSDVRSGTARTMELIASDALRPLEASGGWRNCAGLKEEDLELEYPAVARLRLHGDRDRALDRAEAAMVEDGWELVASDRDEYDFFQVLRDDVRVSVKDSRVDEGVVVAEVSRDHGCVTVDGDAPAEGESEPIALP